MNTNNKGVLRIDRDENNSLQVIFKPVNSTVWLFQSDLPALFNVSAGTIHACLDLICKEKVIDVGKSCKCDLYVRGERIRYDIREINLEVVIAMAFRIGSPHAKILREWLLRRCLYPGIDISSPLSETQNFCLN